MYWGNGSVYEFSVNVTISNVTDLAGWQFGLYWNNNYLNCDSVTIQPLTPNWTSGNTLDVPVSNGTQNLYNSTNGWFCYAIDTPDSDFTSNGTQPQAIATLIFHQLANVSTSTQLIFDDANTELVDGNWNDIPFSSTAGLVEIYAGNSSTVVNVIGNGSTVQLSPYPANWADWNCCQTNDGDSSYVCTGSSGTQGESAYDLYNASAAWIPSGASNVTVTVHVVVRSTSVSHKATFYAILDSTVHGYDQGGNFVPSTTYQDYNVNFTIPASDGASLQIGVYINPGMYLIHGVYNYYDGYCTQVYAVISYS
jgi:hypothetical protein